MSADPLRNLPSRWATRLAGYSWERQTIGRSSSDVVRLAKTGEPTLFLKSEPPGILAELPAEAARLHWLTTGELGCPHVVAEAWEAGRNWLLITAVPGQDLASSKSLPPEQIIAIAADALRRLHRLSVAGCPFDRRLGRRIEDARARVAAGLVEESDFDAERMGRTAADVFGQLLQQRPLHEDLVVTHGDACLPNLLQEGGRFSGFVDCARLGVADRHQDLALASWSIRYNLGDQWVEPFLRRYGFEPDPACMEFYQLLDEFF